MLANIIGERPSIGFLVEANELVGYGHASRLSSLQLTFLEIYSPIYVISNKFSKPYLVNFFSEKCNLHFINEIFFNDESIESIKNLVKSLEIKILLVDSYKLLKGHEEKLKKIVFLVVVDDHLLTHNADVVINQRAGLAIKQSDEIKNIWLTGAEYSLVSSVKSKNLEVSAPKKVLIHFGGSGKYSTLENFFAAVIEASIAANMEIYAIVPNQKSEEELIKLLEFLLLQAEDIIFLPKTLNLRNEFYKYDIVAGPAGTSTFEALMSKSVVFSAQISDDGRDDLNSWLGLGHLLHFSHGEAKSKDLIQISFQYLLDNYEQFFNLLERGRSLLDGNGPRNAVRDILRSYKGEKFLPESDSQYTGFNFSPCDITDARNFLNSRNLDINLIVSGSSHRRISWQEHIVWWTNNNIAKFKLGIDESVELYGWIKITSLGSKYFFTSGWFPSRKEKSKNAIKEAFLIMDGMIDFIRNTGLSGTWVVTLKKDNTFAYMLNKKFGLKENIDKKIILNLDKLYPNTKLSDVRVMKLDF